MILLVNLFDKFLNLGLCFRWRQKLPTDLGFPATKKFSDRTWQALLGHPPTIAHSFRRGNGSPFVHRYFQTLENVVGGTVEGRIVPEC